MTTADIVVQAIELFGTYIFSPLFIVWMIICFFFSGHSRH